MEDIYQSNMRPSWSYRSWIHNYLCNRCLLPLALWVRTSFMARCTRYKTRWSKFVIDLWQVGGFQGQIRDFTLGGRTLKKIAPSGGRHENFWGISCEKSWFYPKKSNFFPILGGACRVHPPGSTPGFLHQ